MARFGSAEAARGGSGAAAIGIVVGVLLFLAPVALLGAAGLASGWLIVWATGFAPLFCPNGRTRIDHDAALLPRLTGLAATAAFLALAAAPAFLAGRLLCGG